MKPYNRPLTIWGFLWSLPVTVLGLPLALLSFPSLGLRGGVLLCVGNRGFAHLFLAKRGYAAITLGHILIAIRPPPNHLWQHEREHTRQAQRLGIFFLLAYLFFLARHGYRQNPFEVAARQVQDQFRADNPAIADQLIG
ncbi:MAG: hypothetical protein FJ320_02960 [SAR202 cluster bacterium]|nr:hypothetical protein [SAR202 cluster bacterium]